MTNKINVPALVREAYLTGAKHALDSPLVNLTVYSKEHVLKIMKAAYDKPIKSVQGGSL